MFQNTKAVLFDLDGTLVDSLGDLANSANAVLERRSFPVHPTEDYRQFIGDGARKLVERVLPEKAGEELIDEVLAEYLAEYASNVGDSTVPFPGIIELLAELQAFPMGVVTNKPQDLTEACLAHCFPVDDSEPLFAAVVGQHQSRPKKPDPAPLLLAAMQLGHQPSDCIFVGDSGVDMEAALRAKMGAVGVLWGMRDEKELSEAGAEALISEPTEILSLLRSDG